MPKSICDITERLFAEFDHVHPLPTITAAVVRALHDLHGSPELALPELVEGLARYRLTEAANHTATLTVPGRSTMAEAL
jgi:hypothetical protein